MRNRTSFREIDGVTGHREPGRDDVAETDQLGNRSVQADAKHAVVVAVRHEEPAPIRLQGVLHAGWNDEREPDRRVLAGEGPDVRDQGRARWPIDAVDPDGSGMAREQVVGKLGSDDAHESVRGRADERDVHDAAERELAKPPRETTGIQRLLSARGIDAPDLAGRRLGHVQRSTRTDRAAGSSSSRQRREQLGIARRAGGGNGAHGNGHSQRRECRHYEQESLSTTHKSFPFLSVMPQPGRDRVPRPWCPRPR